MGDREQKLWSTCLVKITVMVRAIHRYFNTPNCTEQLIYTFLQKCPQSANLLYCKAYKLHFDGCTVCSVQDVQEITEVYVQYAHTYV